MLLPLGNGVGGGDLRCTRERDQLALSLSRVRAVRVKD